VYIYRVCCTSHGIIIFINTSISITVIIIIITLSGKPRGFGYIELVEEKQLNDALTKLKGMIIGAIMSPIMMIDDY